MADTIQRRRYMEGHRASCNVRIRGEFGYRICSLKGKTAPSLTVLFFPLGLGLDGYHRLHFFLHSFWCDLFLLSTAFFLRNIFDLYSYAKLEKHGRANCILLLKKLRLSENDSKRE